MGWEFGPFGIYEIQINFLEYTSEFFDRGFDLSFFCTIRDLSKSLDHGSRSCSEYLIIVTNTRIDLESGRIVPTQNQSTQ